MCGVPYKETIYNRNYDYAMLTFWPLPYVCMYVCMYVRKCVYVLGICDTVHFVYHVSLQKYGSIRYCITISTVRIMCHYSLKNRAVVEYITDKVKNKL